MHKLESHLLWNIFLTNLILWEFRVESAVAVGAEIERVRHPLGPHHLDGRPQGGVAGAPPQQRRHVLHQLLPADGFHRR